MTGAGTADPREDGSAACAVPTCTRDASIGFACGTCFATLDRKLGELPSLFARLNASPMLPVETMPGPPSFESKSPANDSHIALRDPRTYEGPIDTMQKWSHRFWMMKAGVGIEREDDFSDLCRGGAALWSFWVESDFAAEYFDDISRIWEDLALAVGELVKTRPVGICKCGMMLFWRKTVVCDSCKLEYRDWVEISLAKAVLSYQLACAPFWKTLIRQSKVRTGELAENPRGDLTA